MMADKMVAISAGLESASPPPLPESADAEGDAGDPPSVWLAVLPAALLPCFADVTDVVIVAAAPLEVAAVVAAVAAPRRAVRQ